MIISPQQNCLLEVVHSTLWKVHGSNALWEVQGNNALWEVYSLCIHYEMEHCNLKDTVH